MQKKKTSQNVGVPRLAGNHPLVEVVAILLAIDQKDQQKVLFLQLSTNLRNDPVENVRAGCQQR